MSPLCHVIMMSPLCHEQQRDNYEDMWYTQNSIKKHTHTLTHADTHTPQRRRQPGRRARGAHHGQADARRGTWRGPSCPLLPPPAARLSATMIAHLRISSCKYIYIYILRIFFYW